MRLISSSLTNIDYAMSSPVVRLVCFGAMIADPKRFGKRQAERVHLDGPSTCTSYVYGKGNG